MDRKSQSLLKQSVMSNLKYWGKRAERIFAIFAGAVIFYTFLMSLSYSSDGADSAKEVARQFKIYAVTLGIVLPLVGINSFGVTGVGIAMSFGARRSETLWGIQLMVWLSAIQIFLFVAVGNYLTGDSFTWMKMYLPILMMSVGAGEFVGCANIRFGWKGVLGSVLFYCVVVVGGGILFICSGGLSILLNGQTGKLFLPLLIAAVLLCIAGGWCWKKVLASYEVKV